MAWWTGVLFMVGSFCFALGSLPGFSAVVAPSVVGIVFFTGSIFFTTAALLQLLQAARGVEWVASLIQLVGTVWFNINTFDAMQTGLTTREENLRIWTPDVIGSICFLVSSWMALGAVCRAPWCLHRDDSEWWIAAANLLGSVFFMLAAIGAFVLPSADDLLDASLVNSGTFLGAVCFLWAARLQITCPSAVSVAPA
jgi:YrhK-like protein